ncbi:protein-L-isoaspartate O-methyltransferase family protein [Salinarimonas soli]|uniref:Protein-L-isoaspartate O-methyltransferase n=1 Tax=Salinarimonas soli TaxID=1638099 RepID=A0A5B2VGN1_9HYPH|nr:methyltransferase domain-containing protein [Salinarimonas soli]KAA2238044.1 SAM-dependent methyltransferase [Salinarimonas soli]
MPAGIETRRRAYADAVTHAAGVASPRLHAAFASVPRERFLAPPPWTVFEPGDLAPKVTFDPADLYQDALVAIDPARRINNGQPSLHARWLAAVDPRPGDRVVQIGAGTGYYTALLAELVRPTGRIDAYEIEADLAEIARANLRPYADVTVHAASAVGVPLPPADVIYVSAAASVPAAAWLDALAPGGRLVMPWEPVAGLGGVTLLVRRETSGFSAVPTTLVGFIPCQGLDERPRARVHPDALLATRSLWRVAERAPDEAATAVFTDLWFSSSPLG